MPKTQTYHVGDTAELCWFVRNDGSDTLWVTLDDYQPANYYLDGLLLDGPHSQLEGIYVGPGAQHYECYPDGVIAGPQGFEAFRPEVRYPSEGQAPLLEHAELWIYVAP